MKAAAFGVVRADSVEQVLAVLDEHGDEARVIAGGQSLGPLMALRLAAPTVLVDLARVRGLDIVEAGSTDATARSAGASAGSVAAAGVASAAGAVGSVPQGAVRVGAMVRQRTIEHDVHVRRAAPLLADAVPLIGHTAIRSQGTVCGSLAHADPAAELPAVALAAGATMHLRSAAGTRALAAADFFTGYYSTAIAPGEILEAVSFPPLAPGTGTAFVEFSRRHGDFALVGVAASVTVAADGTVTAASLALTGVASTPWPAIAAARLLLGAPVPLSSAGRSTPYADVVRAAAEAVRVEVDPGGDLHATAAHRRHLAAVLTTRALTLALARAGTAGS